MTALVIGGSGVIGQRLCSLLVGRGIDVIATSRRPRLAPEIPGVRWRGLRLSSFEDWDRLLRKVDTVYHLAWSTIPASAVLDPAHDLADNVVGTVRMLEAARKRANIRIVFASSGGTVYGPSMDTPINEEKAPHPLSAFGLSKLVVERYIENYHLLYGLDGVSLRIGNCYGSGQQSEKGLGAVTLFVRSALKGQPISIAGNGEVVRDYIHVDDVAEALIAAAHRRKVCGSINIGSGVGYSLNQLVAFVRNVLGPQVEVEHLAPRPFDVPVSVLDINRARHVLGWAPSIELEDGIRRVAAELLAEGGGACAWPSSYTAIFPSTSTEQKLTHVSSPANFGRLATSRLLLQPSSRGSGGKAN